MPPRLVEIVVAALLFAPCSHGGSWAASDPGAVAEARVHRVESGLVPAVLVRGEPFPRMVLRARMKKWNTPAVSIAVIDHGAIAWARAYGVVEAGGPDSVTTETRFQAGSVSKPVAAMTALRLVEEGRLALDDDVNRSLSAWRIPPSDSSRGAPVTLRRLLTHSAGLTVHGFPGYAVGDSVPTLAQVLDGVRPANTPPVRIEFLPGSRFQYSGGGYTVVQQLLVDVTGEPYADLVERAVFRPLGMAHSTYDALAGPGEAASRAAGHDRTGAVIPGRWHRYPELAAAGLWTTPSDLARVALEVQAAWKGASHRVLSPDMTRAMLSPQITPTQGIGWRLAGSGPSARFEHSGDTAGYKCAMVAYLARGQGAVVMTNGEGGGDLAQEILRGIAREYDWPNYLPEEKRVVRLAPQALAPLAGRYVLDVAPNVFVEIATRHDSLFAAVIQPSGTERGTLLAESPTRFFERESGIEITFMPGRGDHAPGLTVRQGDEEYRATRVH